MKGSGFLFGSVRQASFRMFGFRVGDCVMRSVLVGY